MGNKIKTFPVLYSRDSKDKIRMWSIWVEEVNSNHYQIVSKHGLKDGQKQIERIDITEGKNLGRANETTEMEQAISEAQSKWNSRKDTGYADSIKEIPEDMLPMLAKKYGVIINGKLIKSSDSKHITFPCFVQPKFDGVRCLAKRVNGVVEFISRKGKKYHTLKHIEKELMQVMELGEIFDGEIYVHGETFQDIISAVKNVKGIPTLSSNKLEYHIYDLANKNMDYKDRLEYLKKKLTVEGLPKFNYLKMVFTTGICKDEVMATHKIYVDEGFEGIILRNKKGKYEFDNRSNNLQKLKEFFDEEFKIVDMKEGIGRFKGCGTFICETKDGSRFDCNMKCSYEEKKKYWNHKNDYIGKLLTVRFQEKSKDNIPRFPVGVAVRDYE